MKIINNLYRLNLSNHYSKKANNVFYNQMKKHFSLSLSFKNKINSFFKYVHPDVLGGDTPEEYRKTNEKSIQEINSYIENLNEATNFVEKKTIYFYVKIDKKMGNEKSQNMYEKIFIDLENLKPEMSQSNKFAIQSNLGLAIEEMVRKISKIKAFNAKEELTQKDIDDFKNEDVSFADDRPKIYKHKDFVNEMRGFQSAVIAYKNKTVTDHEKAKMDLVKKIDRAINNKTDFFQNRRNPDIQAKFLVESLSSFGHIEKNLFNSFPLQLIFLDEKITQEQTKIFMDRFNFKHVDEVMRFNEMSKFNAIAEEMLNKRNLIRLFISDKYDIYEMPGYLKIPYNFDTDELVKYFHQNKFELCKIKEKFIDDNNAIEEIKNELKKSLKIRTINFYPKGDKEIKALVKLEQLSMGLKRIRKIFIDNFTEIIKKEKNEGLKYKLLFNLDNLEVNFYKPKTELIREKNGKTILNISHPINEDFIVKLIKNKINFFDKKEEIEVKNLRPKENKYKDIKF